MTIFERARRNCIGWDCDTPVTHGLNVPEEVTESSCFDALLMEQQAWLVAWPRRLEKGDRRNAEVSRRVGKNRIPIGKEEPFERYNAQEVYVLPRSAMCFMESVLRPVKFPRRKRLC